MGTAIVRYKALPDAVEENIRLIEGVFAELNAEEPEGLRYATFRLDDGLSFVHVVVTEGDADPLAESTAFAAFQKDARQRMDGPPVRDRAHVVGSYGFFGEQGIR